MLRNRGEDYNDFVTESYYYRDLIKGKKVSPCPNDYNSSIQTQKQYEEWLKQKHQELTKRPKKPPGTLICTGYFYMFHSVLSCVILTALSNRDPATGGGEHMEIVISFLPTGIIAYADHEINMLRLCKSVIFPPFVTKLSQNHIFKASHTSRNALKSTLSRLHSINTLLSFLLRNDVL